MISVAFVCSAVITKGLGDSKMKVKGGDEVGMCIQVQVYTDGTVVVKNERKEWLVEEQRKS